MKLYNNIFLIIVSLLFLGQPVWAQQTITGNVTDKTNGEALIGVNIYLPEYSRGAVTDINGEYRLDNLPKGDIMLTFSYIGYKKIVKKIFPTDKNIVLNIEMETLIIQGEEVVITGSFTSTQHENTVRISTIDAKQLLQSGSPGLVQSIVDIPGVDLISKGPGIGTPVIRGLSLSNILFLNNGVPMQNYQFSENHPYLIDEHGVERIEVIKGPSSLIYGSGAVGGVINLIAEPVAPEGKIMGHVSLKYFSNTSGISTDVGLKGNQKGLVWGIRTGVTSHKDYYQGNDKFVPNTRFNRNSLKTNVGLIRKIGSFKLLYEYNEDKLGMAVAPAFMLVTKNDRRNYVWFQDLNDHLIISRNKIYLGKIKLDVNLAYQLSNRQLKGSELTPVFTLVNMTLQTFSYRLKTTYSINENAKVIFGIQGMSQENKNGEAPEHVLPDAHLNDISTYALGRYHFGELLIVEAGLRYSYRGIHVPLHEVGGNSHGDDHEDEEKHIQYDGQFNNVSASFGGILYFSSHAHLRINLASAYRSPNIAELTQYGMHGTRFEEGNTDLQIQQNLEGDIGFHFHTKNTSIDLSSFYNNVNNYIFLGPTTDTTNEGQLIYRYSQTHARLFGGEAVVHIHPHPLDWLHLKSTFSYVIGEKIDEGYLPFIPAHKWRMEIMLKKDRWKRLRNFYIKGGTDLALAQNRPSEFETSSPAYNLIDLSTGVDIMLKNQPVNLSITATNLSDISYIDHLSTLKGLGVYNMGRNVVFSVKVPFLIKK